ncbi:SAF domain-containing protein [Microbacterium sp. CIAB417]|uniref:SAF domain-containing protein n=1 Tax=Microbacterium sp. CIAB417 TaxID=2860287 RepID=UPI001FAB9CBF|nr:SAF domain-containing protein [Microbacterium sp. CIAB417]
MTTPTRARRTPWADARFFIGVALVVLSIVGVWLIVDASRSTTPVLRADRTIVPGEALSSADFSVVEVSLGTAEDQYLAPQDLTAGHIATRAMAEGELLSAAAVGDADDARTTTIVVESSVGLPAEIDAGTVVELWQAPPLEEGYDEPRILVADVTVASLVDSEGMMTQDRPAVELVIDRADVADVLSAITGGAALSIVPLGSR